jgi:hypothetical protein
LDPIHQVPKAVAESMKNGSWEKLRKKQNGQSAEEAAKVAQAVMVSVEEAARLHKYQVKLGHIAKVNKDEMREVMQNLDKRKEIEHKVSGLQV